MYFTSYPGMIKIGPCRMCVLYRVHILNKSDVAFAKTEFCIWKVVPLLGARTARDE